MAWGTAALLVLGFAGGVALAAVHFAALAANVRLYLAPRGAWRAASLHAARWLLTLSALALAATLGAPALLACLAGFTAGRLAALRSHA